MQDFTLVIPTYNRPKQLAALLAYLGATGSDYRILILDSSEAKPRVANRKLAESAKLKLDYIEFPSETHPFNKFKEGVDKVATQFCALCADDDLVVPDGVKRCLEALRSNPQASVAQGYSFSFLCHADGTMDLGNILYFSSTIDDATPLERVAKLFTRYQAATYGNYRTPILQRIFDTLKPMTSILARELLGTALAAVGGEMIRVPCFSHGRSMDSSESYEHWHPLEWFANDPQGLFWEYRHYRELITQAVFKRPDNSHDAAAVRRVLDLIHLRYMAKHAPDGALAFMTEQKMLGVPFEAYWPRPEIHQPLYEAARIGTSAAGSMHVAVQKSSRRSGRTYNLHPNFFAPLGTDAPPERAVTDLLHNLDHYDFYPPHSFACARRRHSTRRRPSPYPVRFGTRLLCQCCCAITIMHAILRIRSAPFATKRGCPKKSSCSMTARVITA